MATRFGSETWSVVVPDGWRAQHDAECATLVPLAGGSALQISAAFKGTDVSDADLENFASDQLQAGAKPLPTSAGDFVGFEIAFREEGAWWRYWYLRNGSQMLFVTYNCSLPFQGRDNRSVRDVLSSLASAAPPNKALQPTRAAGPNGQREPRHVGPRG